MHVIERMFFLLKKANWFPLRNEFSNKVRTGYKRKKLYKILIDYEKKG